MLLTCLNSVTIKNLISLYLITIFFKLLLNYLVESYKRSNNINIGAIRTRGELNFYYN